MGKVTEQNRKPGSNRLKSMIYGKYQRTITPQYRKEYERIFRNKKTKENCLDNYPR